MTSSTGMPAVTLEYGLSGGAGRWEIPMTLRTTVVDVDGVATAWVAQASIPSFTRQGGIIAYTVTIDDGHQQAASPPLDGTVTVGHLVAPLGLSL